MRYIEISVNHFSMAHFHFNHEKMSTRKDPLVSTCRTRSPSNRRIRRIMSFGDHEEHPNQGAIHHRISILATVTATATATSYPSSNQRFRSKMLERGASTLSAASSTPSTSISVLHVRFPEDVLRNAEPLEPKPLWALAGQFLYRASFKFRIGTARASREFDEYDDEYDDQH